MDNSGKTSSLTRRCCSCVLVLRLEIKGNPLESSRTSGTGAEENGGSSDGSPDQSRTSQEILGQHHHLTPQCLRRTSASQSKAQRSGWCSPGGGVTEQGASFISGLRCQSRHCRWTSEWGRVQSSSCCFLLNWISLRANGAKQESACRSLMQFSNSHLITNWWSDF